MKLLEYKPNLAADAPLSKDQVGHAEHAIPAAPTEISDSNQVDVFSSDDPFADDDSPPDWTVAIDTWCEMLPTLPTRANELIEFLARAQRDIAMGGWEQVYDSLEDVQQAFTELLESICPKRPGRGFVPQEAAASFGAAALALEPSEVTTLFEVLVHVLHQSQGTLNEAEDATADRPEAVGPLRVLRATMAETIGVLAEAWGRTTGATIYTELNALMEAEELSPELMRIVAESIPHYAAVVSAAGAAIPSCSDDWVRLQVDGLSLLLSTVTQLEGTALQSVEDGPPTPEFRSAVDEAKRCINGATRQMRWGLAAARGLNRRIPELIGPTAAWLAIEARRSIHEADFSEDDRTYPDNRVAVRGIQMKHSALPNGRVELSEDALRCLYDCDPSPRKLDSDELDPQGLRGDLTFLKTSPVRNGHERLAVFEHHLKALMDAGLIKENLTLVAALTTPYEVPPELYELTQLAKEAEFTVVYTQPQQDKMATRYPNAPHRLLSSPLPPSLLEPAAPPTELEAVKEDAPDTLKEMNR